MGVNEDLMQAAKDSLRAMVEHISTTDGLEPVGRAGEPGGGPEDLGDSGPAELDRLLLLAAGHIRLAGQDPLLS
jgi:hypothetical protein